LNNKHSSLNLTKLKGILVYLLGPEGAGKTTQIQHLLPLLKSNGFRVKVIYIRSDHLVLYLLKLLLIKMGRCKDYPYLDGTVVRAPDAQVLKKIGKFWLFMQIPMSLILTFFRVYIPLKLGYVVIAERYLLDTIIDTLGMSKWMGLTHSRIPSLVMRCLLHFMPKKSLIIHLYADYNTLRKRYHLRGTPVEPLQWIKFQLTLDKIFCKVFNAYTIKTDEENPVDVFRRIVHVLNSYCT